LSVIVIVIGPGTQTLETLSCIHPGEGSELEAHTHQPNS
jgi:hypothetical protein